MGKYYCDYCDVFLTHDSQSVRKAHNSGRNHIQNVIDYYSSLGHNEAQNIIDQITRQYEGGHGGMGSSVMRSAGPFMPPMGGFRPPMMQGNMGMMPPGNFARPPQFVPPGQGPPQGFGGPPGGFQGAPPPTMGMPPSMPPGMPSNMPPQGFTAAPPGSVNGRPPAINPERMRMMGRN
ncbi:hypothetical protein NliqN6_4280 [Naganishia liquefaciens]|uniref:U1 small nuclear ribonucleoprotein C n=1 Tax=Naganishia liquefaciens TaxID=104408 RepID=A0A8H3YG30_9TREE|nr:hypothetical protein NliqN6_4280 [Naganishia liquefaciens]